MGVKLELLFFAFLFNLLIILNNVKRTSGGHTVFDITKYGAKPEGDATKGLTSAWKEACASTSPSKVLVPPGCYRLGPVEFTGPCKSRVTIKISGNFTAPKDVGKFKGHATWISILRVDGLTISATHGAGAFDGQGQTAWKKNSCAKNNCKTGLPYNFRFDYVSNSEVSGITSLNSKSFHMAILGCKQLKMKGMTIIAPGDSPNTDGIHIGRSEHINITNTNIGTGDDCISIGDGTQNLHVEKVTCNPGHGISVGSLGVYPNEKPVTGVTVKGCTIKNSQNGVRIKTYQSSYPCEASALHFEDITMENVWYPILVDQEYCPHGFCKSKAASKVKISGIRFKKVTGTSTMREAVRLICSSALPCRNVELIDVDLKNVGKGGPAVSMCKHVKPITSGKQNPPPCDAPATPSVSI